MRRAMPPRAGAAARRGAAGVAARLSNAAAMSGVTPMQRYLFDLTGYLHLKGAVDGAALESAQAAAERCIMCGASGEARPEGFVTKPAEMSPAEYGKRSAGYQHGFAFDRALEALTMHPAIWPLVKEFTANQPRLVSGTLSFQVHDPTRQPPPDKNLNPAGLHCAREGRAWGTRYAVGNNQQGEGKIFCSPLVVFFYLSDVEPGDGGLIVLPGSHKSNFTRPEGVLVAGPDNIDPEPSPLYTNLTPKAGDFLFCSENLTQCVLQHCCFARVSHTAAGTNATDDFILIEHG